MATTISFSNPISALGSAMYIDNSLNTNNQNLGTNISYGKNTTGFATPSTNYLPYVVNSDGSITYQEQGYFINVSSSETLTDLYNIIQPFNFTNSIGGGIQGYTNATYYGNTDPVHTTLIGASTIYGAWFQYDLSGATTKRYNKVTINVSDNTQVPYAVYFAGSNDGVTWSLMALQASSYGTGYSYTFPLLQTFTYPFLRIIIWNTISTGSAFTISGIQILDDYQLSRSDIATYATQQVNVGNINQDLNLTGFYYRKNGNIWNIMDSDNNVDNTYPPTSTLLTTVPSSQAFTTLYNNRLTIGGPTDTVNISNTATTGTVNIQAVSTGASNVFIGNTSYGTTTINGTVNIGKTGSAPITIGSPSITTTRMYGNQSIGGTGTTTSIAFGVGESSTTIVNIGNTGSSTIKLRGNVTVNQSLSDTSNIGCLGVSPIINIGTNTTGASNVLIGTAGFGKVSLLGNVFVNSTKLVATPTFFMRCIQINAQAVVAVTNYDFFAIGTSQQAYLNGLSLGSVLSGGIITIPYTGMYAVFSHVDIDTSQTITMKLFSTSGTYGAGGLIKQVQIVGISCQNDFTGYFVAGDQIRPQFYTGANCNMLVGSGWSGASIALLAVF